MTSPLEDQVSRVFAAQAGSASLPTEQVLAGVRAQAATRRRRRYAGTALAASAAAVVAAVALQAASPPPAPLAQPASPRATATQPASPPATATQPASPRATATQPGPSTAPSDAGRLADRVRAAIERDRLDGLSAISTDPDGRRVDLWWVGPVPEQLRALAERPGGPRLVIRDGSFTADQLLAATERVVRAFSDPRRHPAWALATVTPTPTGSGLRVGLARPGGGFPRLSAAELASVRRQAQAVAGDVPVVEVFLVPQPVAGATRPPGVKVPTDLRSAEATARPVPT